MPPALAPPDPAHLKALDALRQRLSAVNNALAQTRAQVEANESLPPWPSLQQNLHISSTALTDLAYILSTNHDILSSLHAYPLPTYPSTGPEGIPMTESVRLQLMRKKLEPVAEDLIEEGTKFSDQRQDAVDVEDMQELWDWAADLVPEIIMKQAWNADYTNKELAGGYKNVRTGLKRRLNRDRAEADEDENGLDDDEEDSSDEEEDNDESDGGNKQDAMDVDGKTKPPSKSRMPPAMSVEDMLKYMTKGGAQSAPRMALG